MRNTREHQIAIYRDQANRLRASAQRSMDETPDLIAACLAAVNDVYGDVGMTRVAPHVDGCRAALDNSTALIIAEADSLDAKADALSA